MTDNTLQNALDAIAREGFRDLADYDYISARVSFKLNLREQFYWSALQAVEKYLKAILLFNQQKVKDLGHDIVKASKRVTDRTGVPLMLDESQLQFLELLQEFGNNRYGTRYTQIISAELERLDQTIWTIRNYARNISLAPDGVDKSDLYLKLLGQQNLADAPTSNQISGGALEKILSQDSDDALRRELVWCNKYYGGPENAAQVPTRVHSSSQIPVYERDWFTKAKVYYDKTLSDAVRDFVKFP